jgi:chaperone LolA
MRWEVSLPDESLFVADGKVIYNVDHFVEQVTLIDQSAIVDNNPLMLLISNSPEAWDDVEITQNENEFAVRSTDSNANITDLLLSFPGGILSELTSIDRQEQSNVIVFSNIKQNTMVDASMFAPVYPSTYVIDDQRVTETSAN